MRGSSAGRSSERDGGFTDIVEMHRACGRTTSMERVALSEGPEDPKNTPDFPAEFALQSPRRTSQPVVTKDGSRCCCCVSAFCSFMIAIVLMSGAALLVSPELREMGQRLVPMKLRKMLIRLRPPASGPPPEAGSSAATAAASQERPERKPEVPDNVWPSPPGLALCNSSLPVPTVVFRTWDLPDGWRRVCEKKNSKDSYPFERNWCWVGFNRMCHWNLKSHESWATFQEWASKKGYTPPASDAPFHPLQDPEVCDRPEMGRIRNWTAQEQAEARKWFKENVAVYVLSLPTKGDHRWNDIKRRLHELRIWATRVPGVDMTNHGALQEAKRLGFVPPHFNYSRAQSTAYTRKHDMGSMLGTVGCAAAHFKVQMKVIADASPLAIVMEDDSYPTDDFIPRLWSLVHQELPCDWEVTALLSRCGYGRCVSPHLMRVMPDANEPAWRCHQGSNWGMHAVLYRTAQLPRVQALWKPTVFDEDRPHCMDVDVALASISEKVGYYAVPAVQDPGFLRETNHRSARWDINQAFETTTTRLTTTYFVPTVQPGEPWPGAWNFG